MPYTARPLIPGLRQKTIPQGLPCSHAHRRILISHYYTLVPSRFSVLDPESGVLLGSVMLAEQDGTPHSGYVQEIAVSAGTLYVASDGSILTRDLQSVVSDMAPAVVTAADSWHCQTSASVCTATDA